MLDGDVTTPVMIISFDASSAMKSSPCSRRRHCTHGFPVAISSASSQYACSASRRWICDWALLVWAVPQLDRDALLDGGSQFSPFNCSAPPIWTS